VQVLEASRHVAARPDAVWAVMTDLDGSPDAISAIVGVERLGGQDEFGVGTRWRETRIMFGREASEVMEVTELEPGRRYVVESEGSGARYRSEISVTADGDGARLSMSFAGEPTGTMARLMAATVGRLFMKATRKAIEQDLADIAAAAEAGQ